MQEGIVSDDVGLDVVSAHACQQIQRLLFADILVPKVRYFSTSKL